MIFDCKNHERRMMNGKGNPPTPNSKLRTPQGFTLVELLVVVPSTVIVIAVLTALLISLFGNLLVKNGRMQLEINTQSALFAVRDDAFFAARFAGDNQTGTTDAYAPGGSWNAVQDQALVLYEASFDANRQSADRQLIYERDQPYPCNDPAINENQYSLNTLIYFLSGTTLYRRVLVPDQTANCATTFRLQTCPVAQATPTCPADTVIAEDVNAFTLTYYDRSGVVLTQASLQSNPELFLQVQRVDIVLTLQKSINAETVASTATISIKKTE